jgi:Domain of Unknown Function (DUF1259).
MPELETICQQFADILHGKPESQDGVCSVKLHRSFPVTVMGRPITSVRPADLLFESLDPSGNALNLGEIAILEQEVPGFMWSLTQQGIIISGLHNHWIYTVPNILYIHLQSVEPPLTFARKVAHAFAALQSPPVA